MTKKYEKSIIDENELNRRIDEGDLSPVHLPKFDSFSEIEKYQFCTEIIRYKKSNGLKQKDIGAILDIHKSEVSKLFSYNLKEFSQERLLSFIQALLLHGASIDMNAAYEQIRKKSAKLQKKLSGKESVVVQA